ncbi:MAG: hypothetical protein KIS79_06520, partial [Burkholderiales bacterium]|nr:hypothetical protein [Burkholderiales bacterium]
REVWRAGNGVVTSEGVTVDLHYQFQPEVTLHGSLRLNANARALDGVLTEAPGGHQRAFNLRR